MFAGFQLVTKIEGIKSAGSAHRIELRLVNGEAPGARPSKRSKPDLAIFFRSHHRARRMFTAVLRNREPRIRLMTGGAATFDRARPGADRFLIQRPFAGPAAGEIAQGVAHGRQRPLCGCGLFNHYGLPFTVFDGGGTREDAGFLIHGVAECDINLSRDIFQQDIHCLRAIRGSLHEMQNQVAIAIGESDLQGRLGVEPRAPADVFLRRSGVRRVK